MGKKTAVGAADFPDGEFPKENIKKITFREDGSIEEIEYYSPAKQCVHYCSHSCNCWKTRPYYEQVPWVTYTSTGDNVTISTSGSTSTWDRLG